MYNKHFLIILLLALCIFLIKIDSQGRHKTKTKRTKFAKSQYADFFPPRNKDLFCFLQLAPRHTQLPLRQSDSADTRPLHCYRVLSNKYFTACLCVDMPRPGTSNVPQIPLFIFLSEIVDLPQSKTFPFLECGWTWANELWEQLHQHPVFWQNSTFKSDAYRYGSWKWLADGGQESRRPQLLILAQTTEWAAKGPSYCVASLSSKTLPLICNSTKQ